ncbi:MAG: sugar ABC transporter permease [Anaerolineae bacterium]|nr:sugar ABC transporter permease [Anaerolineae bacterium]
MISARISALTARVRDALFVAFLTAPVIIALGLTVFYPIIDGIRTSFLEHTIRTRRDPFWNNYQNYIDLYESGDIETYFRTTVTYVVAVVLLSFVISFLLALALNNRLVVGRNLLRGLFLISWVIPTVVAAMLWVWMFQPQIGVINYILGEQLNLVEDSQNWLQHPRLSMAAIVMATVWREAPLMFILFLAGLQSIPQDLVEAAQMDGAGSLRVLRHITLPLMLPIIAIALLLITINSFQMFVVPYIMTGGGPVGRTTTLSIAAYEAAFTDFNTGEGAAIGVMWLVSLVFITLIVNLLISRTER